MQYDLHACKTILENVEHCGGEPEQAANGFGIGFVTGTSRYLADKSSPEIAKYQPGQLLSVWLHMHGLSFTLKS